MTVVLEIPLETLNNSYKNHNTKKKKNYNR